MPNRIPTSTSPGLMPRVSVGGEATTVRVASGDTLARIAKRAGVSVDALVLANTDRYPGLAMNRNAIQVGWTLKVPSAGAAPTQGAATPAPELWRPVIDAPATNPAIGTIGKVVRGNDFGAKLAAGGAQSIELRTKQHLDSIEKTGIGRYFGDHSSWKSMSAEEKKQWITDNAKEGVTPPSPSSIKESSCIGWAMENVGAAYAAAGKSDRWAEIQRAVVAKGSRGTVLAAELKKDGWQAIYWNPDAKNPSDGLAEHSFSASQVAKGKGYYGIEVDGQVINYRPTEGKNTKLDNSGLEKLKDIPFFFGLSKGGMHTFVGRKGEVNEFHWAEMPNSTTAIEQTPLEKFGWNSGLIMVPPGTWKKD